MFEKSLAEIKYNYDLKKKPAPNVTSHIWDDKLNLHFNLNTVCTMVTNAFFDKDTACGTQFNAIGRYKLNSKKITSEVMWKKIV